MPSVVFGPSQVDMVSLSVFSTWPLQPHLLLTPAKYLKESHKVEYYKDSYKGYLSDYTINVDYFLNHHPLY